MLPAELKKWQEMARQRAVECGLDFFEVIYEVVDYNEMNELASLGGFPQRYPHWRFGMEFDRLSKSYSYGLSKIYEMVINTDPCYAYLLSSNSLLEQKLVMAHVYGHSDFFKNNVYFSHTNRRMLDQMANHSVQVRRIQEKIGVEAVEEFVDCCLSLENLIDQHGSAIKRKRDKSTMTPEEHEAQSSVTKIQAKSYMDKFINPKEYLAEQQKRIDEDMAREERFPDLSERDVLGFLLQAAPLKGWQQELLDIVREEAYYFAPQGQTKIMNEGWASFWHTHIMTKHLVTDAEIIDYACVHSGTVATAPGQLNPYKIGLELFRDIEERWNKGQFGKDWEECDDYIAKGRWDKNVGLGRKKIFEVRKLYNDITFIDEFLTEDFCQRHKLFSFAFNDRSAQYEIQSREFKAIKTQLLNDLTNFGQPMIEIVDSNFENRGELLLKHTFEGRELKSDFADLTLRNLSRIWGRPVNILTVLENKETLISFDGQELKQKTLREA
jgi:stage V sporulation protein R